MVKNLLYSEEEFFRQIVEQAKLEGVSSREEWDDFVEQMIEERLRVGEFDPDEDLENLETTLQQRYDEYQKQNVQ